MRVDAMPYILWGPVALLRLLDRMFRDRGFVWTYQRKSIEMVFSEGLIWFQVASKKKTRKLDPAILNTIVNWFFPSAIELEIASEE